MEKRSLSSPCSKDLGCSDVPEKRLFQCGGEAGIPAYADFSDLGAGRNRLGSTRLNYLSIQPASSWHPPP